MKKWLFRILMTVAVLGALALFGLQISSGTSDSHKRGLEQAFSQIFGGEATFGTLKAFNLFPQFSIDIENLRVGGIKGPGFLSADQMLISFGPVDLLMKSRIIEDFRLKNFKVSAGVYTPLELKLADVGIYPNEKKDAANFMLTGTYGTQKLEGQFAMEMTSGMRPKYFFKEENIFAVNLGSVQINGLFKPYSENGAVMTQLKMIAQKKNGQIECLLPPEKIIGLSAFFTDVLGEIATIKSPADLTNLCNTLKK